MIVPAGTPAVAPPMSALLERFGDRIAAAVDDFEVAVALEAGGITDQIARREYGAADVFELGAKLRTQVSAPSAAHEPAARPDWYGPLWLALPRGFAYVLAGVVSMMAVEAIDMRGGAIVMIVANVIATGMMHSLSYLGHVAVQRSEPGIAAASLRRFLLTGVAASAAVGAVLAMVLDWRLGALASVPLIYVMSVVVLLVLGRDRTVVSIMVPVGATSLWFILSGGTVPSAEVALSVAGVGIAVLFCIALWATRAVGGSRPPLRLGVIDLRAIVPLALGGLAIAGFVGANVIALSDLEAMAGTTAKQWLLLALPFFLTIVFAEFGVIAVRRRLVRQLSQGIDVAQFARTARRATARMWMMHTVLGLVGIVLALVLVHVPKELNLQVLIAIDFFFVGSVLLAALLLVSNDAERPLARFVPPVVVALLVVRIFVPGPNGTGVAIAICALGAALALLLGISCVVTTADLRAHR